MDRHIHIYIYICIFIYIYIYIAVPSPLASRPNPLAPSRLRGQPICVSRFPGRALPANWPLDTETAIELGLEPHVVLASHLHPDATAAEVQNLFCSAGDVLELRLTGVFIACEAKLTYDRKQVRRLSSRQPPAASSSSTQ